MKQCYPLRLAPLKSFEIKYQLKWNFSKSGLPIGLISVPHIKSFLHDLPNTTPQDANEYMPETAILYVHWIFALHDREIKTITTPYAGTMLNCFEFFVKNHQMLINDVRKGTITNFGGEITESVLNYVRSHPAIKPNPQRADEIWAETSKGFKGIAKRIWPRLSLSLRLFSSSSSFSLP